MEVTKSSIPPSAQPHMSASQAETQDQTQYTSLQGNIYGPDEDLDLNGSEEDDVSDGIPDTSKVEVSQSPTTWGQETMMYNQQQREYESYKRNC